jgi:hypothetical protein
MTPVAPADSSQRREVVRARERFEESWLTVRERLERGLGWAPQTATSAGLFMAAALGFSLGYGVRKRRNRLRSATAGRSSRPEDA